eukprot:381703-Prorocentrum_minimum.AAC.1
MANPATAATCATTWCPKRRRWWSRATSASFSSSSRTRRRSRCVTITNMLKKKNTLPLEAGGRGASTTMSSWRFGALARHAVVSPRPSIA